MTVPPAGAPEVVVQPDADLLAESIAGRLLTTLADAQGDHATASVALTGGGIGTASLAAVARSAARHTVDWRRVEVWWGDERFLPQGHPDRNETGARAALLDHVSVDPRQVHPMPASSPGPGEDPDVAAARYSAQLLAARRPALDVCLLGVGPDGHVASLFPGQETLDARGTVVAVRAAPKPPPTRLSLTFDAINAAREVWLLVAGEEKADAVARALAGADPHEVPAAGVRGRERTRWLLDEAAASALS